ncbi:hypothetical protein L218DRAFT_879807, partial [Marasmius fiardii PR-910]
YSDDDSDNVGSMPLVVGYQESAEVDGMKQLPEQEEKRWKRVEMSRLCFRGSSAFSC